MKKGYLFWQANFSTSVFFFVQWTNQMKDVISLTSKVSRRQGIDLSLQQQHPVKIFKAKKKVVSSTTKSLGCWSMPRDEMWVWCQKKTPKQWDHIWLWSFKYRNGQPRKREQPKRTSKKTCTLFLLSLSHTQTVPDTSIFSWKSCVVLRVRLFDHYILETLLEDMLEMKNFLEKKNESSVRVEKWVPLLWKTKNIMLTRNCTFLPSIFSF